MVSIVAGHKQGKEKENQDEHLFLHSQRNEVESTENICLSRRYSCFVLFCFVLFCFVLFCFALLCFALFCFVLFCFVLCFVFLGVYRFSRLGRMLYRRATAFLELIFRSTRWLQ
jgi:Flp pilus assembly protein TadB